MVSIQERVIMARVRYILHVSLQSVYVCEVAVVLSVICSALLASRHVLEAGSGFAGAYFQGEWPKYTNGRFILMYTLSILVLVLRLYLISLWSLGVRTPGQPQFVHK